MARTMYLNGVIFEVRTTKKNNRPTADSLWTLEDCRTLSQCYERPSQVKKNVYAWWRHWFATLSAEDGLTGRQFCGVQSYNTFSFTLGGIVRFKNGKEYIVEITPAHNRLVLVNN